MSSMDTKQPSPFDGLPDLRFFYNNLDNLDVLAALRFGIEARKGLILFTGDAGSGKSAVLQKLTRELNPSAGCILVSDPHLPFSELLRLILRTLQEEVEADDEAALIRRCKAALRSRLETNRIVALAFDDAQHLPNEIIESLTRNFLGKGFDPDNNLLQIVLAGRPELRKRFFMPPLRWLETQVEVGCRLQPLDVKQVELYIKHRLGAAGLPTELFDRTAIERIAVYSDGLPGRINLICGRALQLAGGSHLEKITADAIADALRDLGLETSHASFDSPRPRDQTAGFQSTAVPPPSFANLGDERNRQPRSSPAQGGRRAILAFLIILAFGVAAWLHGGSAISYVREWGAKVDEIVGSPQQIPDQATIEAGMPPPAATQNTAASVSNAEVTPAQPDQPGNDDLSVASADTAAELPSSVQPEPPAAGDPESLRPTPEHGREEPPKREPAKPRRDPTKQVVKAIENRAILGVSVAVIDGIAYLDGSVATPEQKNAAETAARSVPEVRDVRNRIAIE